MKDTPIETTTTEIIPTTFSPIFLRSDIIYLLVLLTFIVILLAVDRISARLKYVRYTNRESVPLLDR